MAKQMIGVGALKPKKVVAHKTTSKIMGHTPVMGGGSFGNHGT